MTGLASGSLRLRVTVAVIAVLAVVLLVLGVLVAAIVGAQSERNLDALLAGRVQLARQLARNGSGPQQIVNRVEVNGVQAHLELRNGTTYGTPPPAGEQVETQQATLNGPGRVRGAQLTVSVDTSLVADARATLRRVLLLTGLGALGVSALLITLVLRTALRPLEQMADLARRIAAGERGHRLQPARTDTEIGQTAQALDAMLDELEGAEARAWQAEQRTRSFLADAAHELRTPLAGVQAAAEALLHHRSQLSPAERERLEALVVREAQRSGALVSDLLASARLDAGLELDVRPVPLRGVVEDEVERARLLHPAMTLEVIGPALAVPADADRLAGIIRNLVDNAVRAAGPTGWVSLRISERPGWALLQVLDSGPGVPPADRERIFDRLVRLDSARGDGGGSGLGLAIARGYARAHGGGLVCAEPEGPAGGHFVLSLPLPRLPGPVGVPAPTAVGISRNAENPHSA